MKMVAMNKSQQILVKKLSIEISHPSRVISEVILAVNFRKQ